jgi:hypothetical protein
VSLKFRTRDDARWGAGKGANLLPVEVDENFWDLLQRLQAVEENPAQPLQIGNIAVSGNRMTITLSDGVSAFGPFILPQAAFHFTGPYEGGHDYAAFDFFIASDGLYLVLLEHTSGSEFDPDARVAGQALYQFVLPFPNLYDIGFFFPGKPGAGIDAGAAMFTFLANRKFFLPDGLAGSSASLETAATAALTFSIRKNATEIGTISIAAGATAAAFAFATPVQFDAGDRLRVLRPAALDATAKDFSVNFAARKGTFGS